MCWVFGEARLSIRFPSMRMTLFYLFLYQLCHYPPRCRFSISLGSFQAFKCLVFWCFWDRKLNCPNWVAMELHVNDVSSTLAILRSPLPLSWIKSIQNLVVQHSLRIWAQLRKDFGFHSFPLLSPISKILVLPVRSPPHMPGQIMPSFSAPVHVSHYSLLSVNNG